MSKLRTTSGDSNQLSISIVLPWVTALRRLIITETVTITDTVTITITVSVIVSVSVTVSVIVSVTVTPSSISSSVSLIPASSKSSHILNLSFPHPVCLSFCLVLTAAFLRVPSPLRSSLQRHFWTCLLFKATVLPRDLDCYLYANESQRHISSPYLRSELRFHIWIWTPQGTTGFSNL